MGISVLWRPPRVNLVTGKAYSVPVLNPIDKYGRTFFFSTFGFFIAFMSWYAFPPLLSKTIKEDLKLSQNEIANSNILALTATLLVRLVTGPLCDRFGARIVFAYILILGSIPTVLAGTVTSAEGLIVLRFFIGILGATFVPCQVWSTGFFEKSVVGTANALMAGIGNAGGGVTYFVMPAIFDSLVQDRGLTPHKAWRVAFVVPFVLINATALGMLLLCEDTPTGPWSDRQRAVCEKTDMLEKALNETRTTESKRVASLSSALPGKTPAISNEPSVDFRDSSSDDPDLADPKAIKAEVVIPPTWKETVEVFFSLQTLALSAGYACSFGGELAINSILGAYFMKFGLNQTESGRWASMFGLVNVFFRPLGGILSDIIYKWAGRNVNTKKYWLSGLGICMGAVALAIGLVDPDDKTTMFCLVVLLALFMDASNGASFAVVPHVHPFANGIVSGFVGAGGNLGGVIFALLFRVHGTNYGKVIWIFGAVSIGINLIIGFVRTLPKGQIGGQ